MADSASASLVKKSRPSGLNGGPLARTHSHIFMFNAKTICDLSPIGALDQLATWWDPIVAEVLPLGLVVETE